MATFFGMPLNEFSGNLLKSAGIGGVLGTAVGFYEARSSGSDHPFRDAISTGGSWALTDAIVEGGLGILAPGIRSGSPVRSALVSSAIGAGSGFAEGYVSAKVEHEDDPMSHGLRTAAQWAAIDGAIELGTSSVWPAMIGHLKGK